MKWVKQKRKSIWDTYDDWKARNNNCELIVSERNDGTYYFLINSEKHSIRYNSLWQEMNYPTCVSACDQAEKWLEVYLDPKKGGKTE